MKNPSQSRPRLSSLVGPRTYLSSYGVSSAERTGALPAQRCADYKAPVMPKRSRIYVKAMEHKVAAHLSLVGSKGEDEGHVIRCSCSRWIEADAMAETSHGAARNRADKMWAVHAAKG